MYLNNYDLQGRDWLYTTLLRDLLNNLLSQGMYLNNLLSQGTYLKNHIRVRGRT